MMLPNALVRHYDQRRLGALLAILFIALAIPTCVLIWQALGQLKFESYYQYRVQAEELTRRIDTQVSDAIRVADGRGYADFAFLNSAPQAKIQERSPLATWPVNEDLPGVIGYFQIDADGKFSSPILPPAELEPDDIGMDPAELSERQSLAGEIQTILAENELVRHRSVSAGRLEAELAPRPVASLLPASPEANAPAAAGLESADADTAPLDTRDAVLRTSLESAAPLEQQVQAADTPYSQSAFDNLARGNRQAASDLADDEFDKALAEPEAKARANVYGRVQDLKLDEALQKKSEGLKREIDAVEEKEKNADQPAAIRSDSFEPRRSRELAPDIAESGPAAEVGGMTITTFESETDPYEFSLLNSGHFVLFRNVWRNGNRTIQGILVDQNRFISAVVESAFRASTLSDISSLVIGYNDDVIRLVPGGSYPGGSFSSASELDGALLYRGTLSAPLDGLEFIFTARQLPPGPGATVIGWTTLVISIVFVVGFLALYRLGVSQIRLARQQQDFVSAVSHELKTPLTSIRMYGEMLKEGWADEDKRKQYYEYIHDESERLTRLISNVLQLAKISRNEPQFNQKPTAVTALVDQVRSKIANQVERAGFRFDVTVADISAETRVDIDEDCFAQIIINLVDNAIKFSKNADNKSIEFTCRIISDQRVEFTVRDFGPGIPGNQMKKIFRLFYRTESELTRETVGTGIGLAIVHQLTTAMGGKIDVVNRDPGAAFSVSFPSV